MGSKTPDQERQPNGSKYWSTGFAQTDQYLSNANSHQMSRPAQVRPLLLAGNHAVPIFPGTEMVAWEMVVMVEMMRMAMPP